MPTKLFLYVVLLIFVCDGCKHSKNNANTDAQNTQSPIVALPTKTSTPKNETGSFIDKRDGHLYKWVKVGSQIWMAENLAFKTSGSYCLNGTPDSLKYGRFYELTALTKELAPEGWHVPSDYDWIILGALLTQHCGYNSNHIPLCKAQILANIGFIDSISLHQSHGEYTYPYGKLNSDATSNVLTWLDHSYKNRITDRLDTCSCQLYWWSSSQKQAKYPMPPKMMMLNDNNWRDYPSQHVFLLDNLNGTKDFESLPEQEGNYISCYAVRCVKDTL